MASAPPCSTLFHLGFAGSWVFTTTGSGLIWFPMRSWKIFTLGIMEPRAVRGMALVRDKTCLSNYAKLVQGQSRGRWKNTAQNNYLGPTEMYFAHFGTCSFQSLLTERLEPAYLLAGGKPGCRPSQISEQAVISDLKQTSAMAIRKSLPLQLNLTNAPNSRYSTFAGAVPL